MFTIEQIKALRRCLSHDYDAGYKQGKKDGIKEALSMFRYGRYDELNKWLLEQIGEE